MKRGMRAEVLEGQRVLDAAQMQAADGFTIEALGSPSLVLMEVAGRAVAERLKDQPDPIVVLAGGGNNGADGMVVARTLANWGRSVEVVAVGPAKTPDARHQRSLLDNWRVPLHELEPAQAVSWLAGRRLGSVGAWVDALFGVGLTRPLEGPWARLVTELGDRPEAVVAVDLPSGICASTGRVMGAAVQAQHTVSFQFPKFGLVLPPGRAQAGEVEVVDIGIPDRAADRAGARHRILARPALRPRPLDAHKGRFGHVLALMGGPDQVGSGLLMGRGALRSGAGKVSLGGEAASVARVAGQLGALMGRTLGEAGIDWGAVRALAESTDVLALGPSLPPDSKTEQGLRQLLGGSEAPAVLDAGALRALSSAWLAERPGPTILTPHPGEMAHLLGSSTGDVQANRPSAVLEAARRYRAVVVLKGASTLIGEPSGALAVCLRGNPGMATAGAGDVLAGVIAGRWAEGLDAYEAAQQGVWMHARAGDLAAEAEGELGLTAEHLLAHLGKDCGL